MLQVLEVEIRIGIGAGIETSVQGGRWRQQVLNAEDGRSDRDPSARLSEGYDPTIGIMHEGSDGSSKFVFDLMEPERPKIDRAVAHCSVSCVAAGARTAC